MPGGREIIDDIDDLKKAVARASTNDPDAWEQLYRRAHPRLFAFARQRLRDDAGAEEAVSETMTRALEGIDRFDWQGAGFDAWLFGILRNVILEQHRSAARARRPDPLTEDPPPDRGSDPAALAERRDERQILRTAFEQLSGSDREILELRVVGELSSEQCAKVLGKKPSAIRMAQARALERLKTHLEAVSDVA